MNDLLLFWSNVLLVLLEVIVLVFFASVFFKKNLSRRKFGASVILLAISNITALALLDSHFWSKAFAVIIVDAIWLKIAYDDTIMQSIGIQCEVRVLNLHAVIEHRQLRLRRILSVKRR